MAKKQFVTDIENANTSKEILSIYNSEIQSILRLICAENEQTKISNVEAEVEDILVDVIKVQFSYGKYYNLGVAIHKNKGVQLQLAAVDLVRAATKYKLHSVLLIDEDKYTFYNNVECVEPIDGCIQKKKYSLYKILNENILSNIDNLIEETRETRKFKRITDTSKLGYELNTIVNMDCIQGMKQMGDNCVDFVLTDIPYGEVNDTDIERTEENATSGIRVINKGDADKLTFDLNEFLEEIHRVCTNSFVVFCGYEQVSDIVKFFRHKGCSVRLIVWEKTSFSPINGDILYGSNIEVGVWARKHNNGVFNAFCKGTVFKYGPGTRRWHPTQKNEELFKELIED
ncbi:MAG: site-specific DNA-methyltransferase, partial [Lachnospiraceae bacterium]|nr:site-specific DNA-methyltransferase [Lachnospiraceae bacterium]